MSVNQAMLTQVICSKQQSVGDAMLELDSCYPDISINGLTADQAIAKLNLTLKTHDQLLGSKLAEWTSRPGEKWGQAVRAARGMGCGRSFGAMPLTRCGHAGRPRRWPRP